MNNILQLKCSNTINLRPGESFQASLLLEGDNNKLLSFSAEDIVIKNNLLCINNVIITQNAVAIFKFLNLNNKDTDIISSIYGQKNTVSIQRGSVLGRVCVQYI